MTTTTEQAARALAAILRRADAAQRRAQQLEGYFENRRSSSGLLAAIETVRSSALVELAEHELYKELDGVIAEAATKEEGPLTTEQTFQVVERFTARLASAVRRLVEADSSAFMSNVLSVARHNAVLRVLEVLEESIEEAHGAAH